MLFSLLFFSFSFYFCLYSSAMLSPSHGVPLHMLLKFSHDLSPLHMPHYCLASLPAGTCWQAIWTSFIPCFSEHVLPDGGCQQSPDLAVPLPSVMDFAYPCILIGICFLSSCSLGFQALWCTESRHHSEKQECLELTFHKPRVKTRVWEQFYCTFWLQGRHNSHTYWGRSVWGVCGEFYEVTLQ